MWVKLLDLDLELDLDLVLISCTQLLDFFYNCIGSVDVLENWPVGLFMFHSYNHQP